MNFLEIATDRLDFEPGFLMALADRSVLGGFAQLNFAARKFPQASQRNTLGPSADQKTPFVLNDGST
jgi:hypothetical protein